MAMSKTSSNGLATLASCGLLALGLTGCGRRIIDEHCLFQGGDASCEDGETCVVVIAGGVVFGAHDGCLAHEDPTELDAGRLLRLPYGLPRAATPEDGLPERDTVLAILEQRVGEEGLEATCSLDGVLPTEIAELEELGIVLDARERLEQLRKERRIRDQRAWIDQGEADAVQTLHGAIDQWVSTCEMAAGTSSGSSDDSSSGSGSGTSEGPPCTSHADCTDPSLPFCDELGECVSSCADVADGDAACAELAPSQPLCVGDACVACTAEDDSACRAISLLCDPEAHSCVPCTEHSQCGDAACELATGRCFPMDTVAHVGPGREYGSISSAVSALGTGATTLIIHAGTTYGDSVLIGSGMRLAFLAADGERPQWSGLLPVTVAGGTLYVDGLRIQGSNTAVELESDGLAWIDRTEIVQAVIGVETRDSSVAVIRSSMIGYYSSASISPMAAYDNSSVVVIDSTLFGYYPGGAGTNLVCSPSGTVEVRGSILIGQDDGVPDCMDADISYSAINGGAPGTGNVDVGSFRTSWFVSYSGEDYHLTPGGFVTFADIAQWQTGDPTTDIDGDPRPTIDNALDYAGADVP